MFIPTMKRKGHITTIVLPPLDPSKVARGHKQHRGGAGIHADRRTNRMRTRATQLRAAITAD